jgi:hypothetical protein
MYSLRSNLITSAVILLAIAAPAISQTSSPRKTVVQTNQQTTQPTASKQTSVTQSPAGQADYNLGLIVKKIAALEAQVALLKKQNETLTAQVSSQQKLNDQLTSDNKGLIAVVTAHGVSLTSANKKIEGLDAKFTQLNSSYQGHTHHMPPIGQQVLSSIPGMQEIANKSGVGYVKAQWDGIRILFRGEKSFGIDFTGPIYTKP